jgi:hypothetical protein
LRSGQQGKGFGEGDGESQGRSLARWIESPSPSSL